MFNKYTVGERTSSEFTFEAFVQATELETFPSGKQGAIIISPGTDCIPIIRTTAAYTLPSQDFKPIHNKLIATIQSRANQEFDFNNGMVEIYDSRHSKMGVTHWTSRTTLTSASSPATKMTKNKTHGYLS